MKSEPLNEQVIVKDADKFFKELVKNTTSKKVGKNYKGESGELYKVVCNEEGDK